MIYFDQDGTLSVWRWVDLSVVRKKGYFLSVEPRENVILASYYLLKEGVFGGTYSAAWMDKPFYVEEKVSWLNKHAEHIERGMQYYVPCGEDKGKEFQKAVGRALQLNDILLDDNSNVLRQWEAMGGTGVKIYTKENGHHGSWKGYHVQEDMDAREIYDYLCKLYYEKTRIYYSGKGTTDAGKVLCNYLAAGAVQSNRLITEGVLDTFRKHPIYSHEKQSMDAEVIAYYFNPYGLGTWLITEAEYLEEEEDYCLFGYCHLHEWEWTYVRLSELLSTTIDLIGFKLPLEREMYSRGKTVAQIVN